MQLKRYQENALETVKSYLELLSEMRAKAQAITDPDLAVDFAEKAWEKAGIRAPYTSRTNGLGEPLPTFCLKIPTGGGKTLLAVKVIDLVNTIYLRRQTGLVLWIVPTLQIHRQTIQNLKDRHHSYRQHLDLASAGRTLILDHKKGDRFSRQDVANNLVVLMIMLQSSNRRAKDVLRMFKDSGGFQDFFPAEDDAKGQDEFLRLFPNLDTHEKEGGFWGRQIKTSLGNTLRMLSPVIILDEGHKAYSEGAQETLRGFNPCLIVELSATPLLQSNRLVDIRGCELHEEDMIKLDLHVTNKTSLDWKATLLAAVERREVLEDRAREYKSSTDVNIRPICLIQAERTGREQRGGEWIHSEDVREQLTKVIGIPAEQVAVKTSEKDELKEVDDVGGLMSQDCQVRYIITKQALQEGWDCAFAYVLVILTNPSSKNALTQLVGRILRQPYARKTHVRELDESYVFCFQQPGKDRERGKQLMESIKAGFEREGLGDLKGHVATDEEEGPARTVKVRDRFKEAASRTILPVFAVKDTDRWRPVNYEMDIVARIPWTDVNLEPVLGLTLGEPQESDRETVVTLAADTQRVIEHTGHDMPLESGIRVDPVFMTRHLSDIVPNPWQAHEFASRVLAHFRETQADTFGSHFGFIVKQLRGHLEAERERLAEHVFRSMLRKDELRFLIIADSLQRCFPEEIKVTQVRSEGPKPLYREDGGQLELSLFDFVPEDEFSSKTEKKVAWYLEDQTRLFFWYRNRALQDYFIQGWRRRRIYPDFIFTALDKERTETTTDYDRVYVVEVKGMHLMGNDRTDYTQKLFDICTQQAESRSWNELGLEMKDRIVRFEVLPGDKWEARLNAILEGR